MEKNEYLELKNELIKAKNINDIEKVIPRMSAYQFLVKCSKNRMGGYALNYLGRKYTYDEFINKINIAAKGFAKLGVKPGENVAMAMLTTPEAIISFYALNKIGAQVYMVNATHEKNAIREELIDSEANLLLINDIFYSKDIKSYVDETNIKRIITSSLTDSTPIGFYFDKVKYKLIELIKKFGSAANSDKRCIKWKEFMDKSSSLKSSVEEVYTQNAGALISSTSGSTGKAKRPVITNENMNAMTIQMAMSCDTFAPGDSIFNSLPIWIIYSLVNSIHEPLCLGVTVDIDPIFSSKNVSSKLKKYKFNHWNTIPSYIEDMLKDPKMKNMNINHIKSITTGGDFRPPKLKFLAEKLLKKNNSDCEVGQGYGLSETSGCFAYTYERGMDPSSVGKPLFGNSLKIIDSKTGEILGPNKSGDLYLYSPTIMKEYFKDSDETNEALVKDENGIVWFKTGDVAHVDEKGQLFLDGRKRRIVITRDSNGVPTKVFPDKIKQVISLHPLVNQCEIVMIPDAKRITRPVAFIILNENSELNSNTLLEINNLCIKNKIESYALPTDYLTIEEMPRKTSQKVDYEALEFMYLEKEKNRNEQSKKKLLFRM